jgi:hypothetical protein
VAAQPGLVYAFYLQANIKELATTWIITLTVVMVLATLRGALGALGARRLVPLALVTVAAFDVLNVAIVPWLGVPLAVFAAVVLWRSRDAVRAVPKRRLAFASAGFVAALAVIAAPIIASARTSFNVLSSQLTAPGDLGNLVTPLLRFQILGIWPSGDYRFPVVTHYRVTYLLLGVALVSTALGAAWSLRRRAGGPLLLLAGSGLATVYLLGRASPYAGAKVMMIFSLAVLLIAMLAAAALHDSGRRLEGWALAAVLAWGVLWTNVLAYEGANVAPRAQFAELASIGSRFSGRGPAFFNLADEFAIHFLRSEAPTDPSVGQPPPRRGLPARTTPPQVRAPWDPDELDQRYLREFPLLVLGRSPLRSRPPSDYQLASRGRYYDVWRRTARPRVLEHVSLGGPLDPAAVPRCGTVMSLARRARREQARLAYATGAPLPVFIPTQERRPNNWGLVDGDPYSLIPRQEAGAIVGAQQVPSSGRYQVWLQGSFSRLVRIWIDGRLLGSKSHELGPAGQALLIDELDLRAGAHQISIEVPNDTFAPGQAAINQTIGPLMFASSSGVGQVGEVDAAHAGSLCGRWLDWIEIVR